MPDTPRTTPALDALSTWYANQCNGEWEHHHGITLETLDNPGWRLTVDLVHTDLQGHTMPDLHEGCGPGHHPVSPVWISCQVRENRFEGACDPSQLPRLLTEFESFRAASQANP